MGEFIKVIPVGEVKVLHPDFPQTAVPEEGLRVRRSVYWSRMAKQGAIRIEDIEESENPEAKPVIKEVSEPKAPEPTVIPSESLQPEVPAITSGPEVAPEPVVIPETVAPAPAIEEIEEGIHVINNSDGTATPVNPETGIPLEATVDPLTGDVTVDHTESQPEEKAPVKKPVKKGAKDAI